MCCVVMEASMYTNFRVMQPVSEQAAYSKMWLGGGQTEIFQNVGEAKV